MIRGKSFFPQRKSKARRRQGKPYCRRATAPRNKLSGLILRSPEQIHQVHSSSPPMPARETTPTLQAQLPLRGLRGRSWTASLQIITPLSLRGNRVLGPGLMHNTATDYANGHSHNPRKVQSHAFEASKRPRTQIISHKHRPGATCLHVHANACPLDRCGEPLQRKRTGAGRAKTRPRAADTLGELVRPGGG